MSELLYERNPKHKAGVTGNGPPRWYPSRDSLCPDDVDTEFAQELLAESVQGKDAAHPDSKARYAMSQGRFFKAYRTEDRAGIEVWHGYPVSEELVGEQIPARVLRVFVDRGLLTKAEYKKLIGSAR
ncbi:MAG: hypothetical protein ACNA8W_26240 [Bradymonadaceae bacterium]